MPRNVYSEINLHVVWHTKTSLPLVTPAIEARVHDYIRHRALQSPGVIVRAVGGIETHVHAVLTVPPTLLIADWIGELKGACSHHVNHGITGRGTLQWQTGYGVVSFGTRDLPWVVEYVRNQREHHAAGTVFDRLERITCMDDTVPEGEEREAR